MCARIYQSPSWSTPGEDNGTISRELIKWSRGIIGAEDGFRSAETGQQYSQ